MIARLPKDDPLDVAPRSWVINLGNGSVGERAQAALADETRRRRTLHALFPMNFIRVLIDPRVFESRSVSTEPDCITSASSN